MSHIPRFDQALASIEAIMQENPDTHMSFTMHHIDPRDVPDGYTQGSSGEIIWFDKQVTNNSEITLYIDKCFIDMPKPSIKPIGSFIQR